MQKHALTIVLAALTAWLTTDLRLQYEPVRVPAYEVAPIQSGPIAGMEFADYFTPYGGLPPADAASVCATGTSTSLCATVTTAETWSGAQTFSNSTPWTLAYGGTSCVGSAQCTGVVTTTNGGATQLKVDTAASTTGFTYSQGNQTGGDTIGTCTGTTSEFVVAKDNNSNMTIKCNGNGTLQGGWTISGGVPLTFNDGGTSCAGSTQCVSSWTTTNAGNNLVAQATAASTDGWDFNQTGTCTATNYVFQTQSAGALNAGFTCGGQLVLVGGTSPAVKITNTTANEIDSNSTGAVPAFTLQNYNISPVTGDYLAICTGATPGTCSSKKASVTNAGDVFASAAHGQIANCAQTTTNASPSLITLNNWACKLTSGSAAATVFTITYPGSVTLTNAPICLVQDLAANVVEPTCTTTTTTATLTYAAAPGAVAFAQIVIFKNGP